MEKVCFKCGKLKSLSEYYKHKKMADGHLNKCKECTKNDAHKHRENNIDRIREYDRNRPNKDERAKKSSEYSKTPKGKHVKKKSMQKYNQDKLKKQAKVDLANAVKYGRIKKPSSCESCGVECKPHGHHDDYSKPLDIRWLCVKCHVNFHNHVREKQRELDSMGLASVFNSHSLIKHVAASYWA